MRRDDVSPDAKPRLQGHALIWMAVSRGQCECGQDFVAAPGGSDDEARNEVFDAHSEHLAFMRDRRR